MPSSLLCAVPWSYRSTVCMPYGPSGTDMSWNSELLGFGGSWWYSICTINAPAKPGAAPQSQTHQHNLRGVKKNHEMRPLASGYSLEKSHRWAPIYISSLIGSVLIGFEIIFLICRQIPNSISTLCPADGVFAANYPFLPSPPIPTPPRKLTTRFLPEPAIFRVIYDAVKIKYKG